MKSNSSMIAGLLCATSMFSQAAEITTFSSAADLQFEGILVQALNLTGTGETASISINGVTYVAPFDADGNQLANTFFNYAGPSDIQTNGTPDYGTSADDDGLESLMSYTLDIGSMAAVTFFGLKPGATYYVYALAANNSLTPDEVSKYYLQDDALGSHTIDSTEALNLTTLQNGSSNTGVLIRLQGVASVDGELTFGIDKGQHFGVFSERPFVSGVVLTEAPVAPGTVIIGGVDTGVTDATTPGGELVSELIADLSWTNHGQYVSAITALLKQLVANGTLTKEEADTIHQIAAQSDIGKKVN